MKAWYVLYTAPKAEKQVALRLQSLGEEVFLPIHLTPRKWSDRIKMVEMPLFPSYIFIKTERSRLYDIYRERGVSRIIYYLGQPAELRENEIQAIRTFLEKAKGKECSFEIDDEVKIAFGPLTGRVGKVKTIKGKHVVLILNYLGLQARVEIEKVLKI